MNLKKASVLTLAIFSFMSLFAAPPADDKSRLIEFAKLKFPILLIEKGSTVPRDMFIDGVVDISGVSNIKLSAADGSGGDMFMPLNSSLLKFRFKETESFNDMYNYYQEGKYADAVSVGRKFVYPSIALMGLSEEVTNVHYLLTIFLDSLVKTERFAEAKSVMDALPLSRANITVGKAIIDTVSAMFDAGLSSDVDEILSRLNFGGDNLENIEHIMLLVNKMREKDDFQNASKWYTKIQSTPNCPVKDEATMWMAYCDMKLGRVNSARIILDQYSDMESDKDVFSLLAMINGLLLERDNKMTEAIDEYAKGIVYGDVSAMWSPELYYHAGLTYKKLENFRASNGIFSQVVLFFPTTKYAEPSKKEIVEIAKSEEDEEDEESTESTESTADSAEEASE